MKLAILSDYAEEGWASMDLCSSELFSRFPSHVNPTMIQPRMKLRLTSLLRLQNKEIPIHILDRLVNRQWDYPRLARKELAGKYDAFHVVDHSYASIVHNLPHNRTGVYCHDLDAFRCLLEPEKERRPFWFRAMSGRILNGMQKAALVFHNSQATGQAILRHRLVAKDRLVYAPLGIADEFRPDSDQLLATSIQSQINSFSDRPIILHVGSNIARKRVDVLLTALAKLKVTTPEVLLMKVGESWTPDQETLIDKLGISDSIFYLGKLERIDLAACYRRASAVLITSEAEGFGLPVIEAMACGAPVVASDIPVLRETGGSGGVFAPVGDIEAWVDCIERVLRQDESTPSRETRLAWASQFSWENHAEIIAKAYQKLL